MSGKIVVDQEVAPGTVGTLIAPCAGIFVRGEVVHLDAGPRQWKVAHVGKWVVVVMRPGRTVALYADELRRLTRP